MYCERSESDTHIRVAVDIEGVTDANLNTGGEFIYCGFAFTLLDDSLAISNKFIGCAKYCDDEIAGFMFGDDEISCALVGILGELFS